MNPLERLFNFLGRIIHDSPAIAIGIVMAMATIVPIITLAFGLLFVAAGGDWSWGLFWTLLVGGIFVGFVLAGALLLKASGVQYARVRWITLVITTVMAGILFKGISALPTAGPLWTTLLWSGFAAVVAGSVLLVLFGTTKSVRPLFVIGVLLLSLGALSGAVRWGWEKMHSSKNAEMRPQLLEFCWGKPPEVVGYSSVRSWCGKARIDVDTPGYLSFSVLDKSDGMVVASFSIDRVKNLGEWKNNKGPEGHGKWQELPVSPNSGVKVLGRFNDETLTSSEKGVWQTFYIN